MSHTVPGMEIFLDPDQPCASRVQNLLERMTLEEKISQLVNDAPGIPRLGIPAYDWWNECLHGVGRAGIATVFPQAIGLAATWNAPLVERIAQAISDEARAKHHEAIRKGDRGRYRGLTFWSPNINIFRDPRWGRGQETYGEDPYLTARLGVAFVRGLQGDHPHYLKTVATPKHFAVHSGPEAERHHFDAQPSAYDLHATYLPAFKACIQEGGAFSIMGAYNRVNGEPCCASEPLLKNILRQEWGFGGPDGNQGYVVSDCGAIHDIYEHHRVVDSPAAAAALALRAGCDLCCGTTYAALHQAYQLDLIDETDIDRALSRLWMARLRLGMFDPPQRVPYAHIPPEVTDCPTHQALALRAARESLVLLKNDGVLPLDPNLVSIAVIGPQALDVPVLLGNYNGTPSHPIPLLDGIRKLVSRTTHVGYARGCNVTGDDRSGFSEAIQLARHSQIAIVCLGLSQLLEGEEGQTEGVCSHVSSQGDRQRIELPAVQESLLKEITATGTPTVLVLLTGSALAIPWAHENLPAILLAWYPGQSGGLAVAETLFGRNNPAGRLPVTFYRGTDQLPPFDSYQMEGRTYRYFQGDVLYHFGYGLSYTHFIYQDLKILAKGDEVLVQVQVQNQGKLAGDEVVQLYLYSQAAPRPIWQLRGFSRLPFQPGEQRLVEFRLGQAELAEVDLDGAGRVFPGEFRVAAGGCFPGQAPPSAAPDKTYILGSFRYPPGG